MKATRHPQKIMVATDLSGRCDRALDRAALLVRQWNAQLLVVHAIEPDVLLAEARRVHGLPSWHRPRDRQAAVAQRLRADLMAEDIAAAVQVVEGDAAQVVLHEAQKEHADLVVTGLARDEPFGRMLLGTTVDRLARLLAVPLLTVRNRVRGPYRRVVVATDLSPASVPALRTALRWFGSGSLTLFHAYATPLASFAGDAHSREAFGTLAADECRRFIAEAGLDDEAMRRVHVVLESGSAESLLNDYARHHEADLVVLGTEGAGGLRKALLGSTAEALLRRLDCDVMVVRAGVPEKRLQEKP